MTVVMHAGCCDIRASGCRSRPTLVLEGDVAQRARRKTKHGSMTKRVAGALVQLWELLDYLCGKRLVAILPEIVVKLEQFQELQLESERGRSYYK